MDRGAWWAMVHGVAKRRAQLSTYPREHLEQGLQENTQGT